MFENQLESAMKRKKEAGAGNGAFGEDAYYVPFGQGIAGCVQ
jgi:hypothetical protein